MNDDDDDDKIEFALEKQNGVNKIETCYCKLYGRSCVRNN